MTAPADTGQDWQAEWRPVIDAIGTDVAEGAVTWGGDAVERGGIRRYLEPLELDCALHTDPEVARAAGHADVTMPATGVIAWTIPAAWTPGQVLFDSDERDAQPVHSAINSAGLSVGPRTTGFFGTDIEVDFLRDVVAGERIGRRGKTLLSCTPKETAVGRGAFMTWESEIVTEDLEVVGRMRVGTYAYQPHEKHTEQEDAS